jgi:hypothetical protein
VAAGLPIAVPLDAPSRSPVQESARRLRGFRRRRALCPFVGGDVVEGVEREVDGGFDVEPPDVARILVSG